MIQKKERSPALEYLPGLFDHCTGHLFRACCRQRTSHGHSASADLKAGFGVQTEKGQGCPGGRGKGVRLAFSGRSNLEVGRRLGCCQLSHVLAMWGQLWPVIMSWAGCCRSGARVLGLYAVWPRSLCVLSLGKLPGWGPLCLQGSVTHPGMGDAKLACSRGCGVGGWS